MANNVEILKLERLIKDAEVRAHTFKLQIETVQKEIDSLLNLEKQLQNNINYLKGNKTIALVAEYKKAKEDLKKTKLRLSFLKADKLTGEKAYKDILNTIEKSKENLKKLSEEKNNVIKGKFGKNE